MSINSILYTIGSITLRPAPTRRHPTSSISTTTVSHILVVRYQSHADSLVASFLAWDGYQGQRQRILNRAHDDQWNNTFIVTGDTHSWWLHEVERDNVLAGSMDVRSTLGDTVDASSGYKRGRMVEFGGSAVSSNGWGATWLNSANATTRAAQLVENSGSLVYSEGFCEFRRTC